MVPIQSLTQLIYGVSQFQAPIVKDSYVDGAPDRFAGAVSRMAAVVKTERIGRGLLVASDTGTFLVGLLGMMRAGVEVILPPNAHSGTLSELAGTFDKIVADHMISGAEIIPIATKGETTSASPKDLKQLPVIFYTSGSQGVPKRVEKSAFVLEAEAQSINAAWGIDALSSIVLGMVPHHHMYGMAFKVIWPALTGQTISAPHYEFWEELLSVLMPNSFIVTSPAQLERAIGLETIAPNLRPKRILSAGGTLSQQAVETTKSIFGVSPSEVFGSTEAGAIAWRNRDNGSEPWSPFPMVNVTSTSGKMVVRSSYSTTSDVTEDRIFVLEDGRFEFLGRADRVVKIEGKRINLSTLEQRISDHPWVADVALVIIREGRERIGAIIKLTELGQQMLDAHNALHVRKNIHELLSRYDDAAALPRSWRFVDVIPSDSLGKRTVEALLGEFERARQSDLSISLTTLPTVLHEQVSPESVEVGLYIEPGLSAFNGHFPGFPVLPGVIQLNWAINFASRYLPSGVSPVNLRVKFQKIITPASQVDLILTFDEAKGRVYFEYVSEQGIHSSGSWMIEDS